MAASEWKFYVYEVLSEAGDVIYVGKGSGHRIRVSEKHRGGTNSRKVALFKRERDAYAYEVQRIAECAPTLNKVAGGNGPRCQIVRLARRNKSKDEKEMDRIGTRAYAARYLIEKIKSINAMRSKVDYPQAVLDIVDNANLHKLMQVAYG